MGAAPTVAVAAVVVVEAGGRGETGCAGSAGEVGLWSRAWGGHADASGKAVGGRGGSGGSGGSASATANGVDGAKGGAAGSVVVVAAVSNGPGDDGRGGVSREGGGGNRGAGSDELMKTPPTPGRILSWQCRAAPLQKGKTDTPNMKSQKGAKSIVGYKRYTPGKI